MQASEKAFEKTSQTWAAVVLAAGTGSRMGGVVKPLIRFGGDPLVCRLVRSLQAAGIERIVVVISPHTHQVRQTLTDALAESAARLTFVEVLADGDQMHSLHQGLLHLSEMSRDMNHDVSYDVHCGVLVCLADQPWIDVQAVTELQAAFVARSPEIDMLVPCAEGQFGHPVALSHRLVQEWLSLDEHRIGKVWRDAHPQRVHRWTTHLTSYFTDLDTHEDLNASCGSDFQLALLRN